MITDRIWEVTSIPIQGHGHVHEYQSAVPQTKYFRSRREMSFTCLYPSTLVDIPLLGILQFSWRWLSCQVYWGHYVMTISRCINFISRVQGLDMRTLGLWTSLENSWNLWMWLKASCSWGLWVIKEISRNLEDPSLFGDGQLGFC